MLGAFLCAISGFVAGFITKDVSSRRKAKRDTSKSKPGSGKARAPGRQAQTPEAKAAFRPTEEYKMVLCVNEDLKMGKGKIGAQCAHAACGVSQRYLPHIAPVFRHWDNCGSTKIALKVQDAEEMEELAAKAASLELPIYIVRDAGRTQIPAGSRTGELLDQLALLSC